MSSIGRIGAIGPIGPNLIWGLYTIGACASLLLAPLILLPYQYSPLKILLATILLWLCAYPTAKYFAEQEIGLPAFPILCLAYAFQFGLPIFTREPTIQLVYDKAAFIDEPYVVTALLLAILGVGALQAGYYAFQRMRLSRHLPFIELHLDEKKAVVYCAIIGVLSPLLTKAQDYLSDATLVQLSAIIRIFQNQVLVAIAILGYLVHTGRGTLVHRILLYSILAVTVLVGISSGFIEQAVAPVITLFIIQWQFTRRVPIRSLALVFLIIIFLSPVKEDYRKALWYAGPDVMDSPVDRASMWLGQSMEYWKDTLSGYQTVHESTEQAVSRTDLIHQFALVCSMTPSDIPHQLGDTYSYFLIAMIPRALWPEKPEAGGANKFFAVNYGLTTVEGAEKSTFGVSLLAESYINFSWPGTFILMVMQGLLLSLLQHLFGGWRSGIGGQAVYTAFFVFFLNGVGTSAEILFGNLLQSLFFSCLLLWWMRVKPSDTAGKKGLLKALPRWNRFAAGFRPGFVTLNLRGDQ